MAGRVAGAVAHIQAFIADLHLVAIVQPARGREMLRGRKSKHRALLRQAVDPELVAGVRADDGQREPLCQLACAARVVDVGVGEPDGLQVQTQALDFGQQPIQIAAGVDDGGVPGLVAPDEGAVLLELGDGNGEVVEHQSVKS